MNDFLLAIPFLTDNEIDEYFIDFKKDKEWIDKQWDLCDREELDCEEVYHNIKEKENKMIDCLSIYIISQRIDKLIDRKENEQFDVTKIKISEDLDNKMRVFDKKLMNIIYGDTYTDSKIEKDISMIHFMSGFSVDKNIKDNKIYILKDVIRRKDNE